MMNYEGYLQVKQQLTDLTSKITVGMLIGKEPRPEGLDSKIEECERLIYAFEHENPYAVRKCEEGRYRTLKLYATADEAIANCPEYDADVYNVVTYEHIHTAEDSFTF